MITSPMQCTKLPVDIRVLYANPGVKEVVGDIFGEWAYFS